MNKFTLRFSNVHLENLYQMQYMAIVIRFFKITQGCLMVATVIFLLWEISNANHSSVVIAIPCLIVLVIQFYIVVYRKPGWATIMLSLDNVMLCFAQIQYLDIISGLYPDPHSSFLLGTIFTFLHVTLLVSPDFLENLIALILIFGIKISIGIVDNTNLFALMLPAFAIYFTHSVYVQHKSRKLMFLLTQERLREGTNQTVISDFIFREAISESLLAISFNEELNRFHLIRCNVASQNLLDINNEKQMLGFLRQSLTTRKLTLENQLLLYKREFLNQHQSALLKEIGVIRINSVVDGQPRIFNTKILISYLMEVQYILTFEDITNLEQQALTIQDMYHQKTKLLCLFRNVFAQNELSFRMLDRIIEKRNWTQNQLFLARKHCLKTIIMLRDMVTPHQGHQVITTTPLRFQRALLKATGYVVHQIDRITIMNNLDPQLRFSINIIMVVHLHFLLLSHIQRWRDTKQRLMVTISESHLHRSSRESCILIDFEYVFQFKKNYQIQGLQKQNRLLVKKAKPILQQIGWKAQLQVLQSINGTYLINMSKINKP